MAIGQHVEAALKAQAEPPKPKFLPNDLVSVKLPRWVAQDLATQARSPLITPGVHGAGVNDRIITLRASDRQALEKIFQTTIESAAQLIDKVRRLSLVKIGEVAYNFNHEELARIDMQAQFHGKTREEFIAQTVKDTIEHLLGLV